MRDTRVLSRSPAKFTNHYRSPRHGAGGFFVWKVDPMAIYITVSVGERADDAHPVLAVADPRVVDAVFDALRALRATELTSARVARRSRRLDRRGDLLEFTTVADHPEPNAIGRSIAESPDQRDQDQREGRPE